MTKTKPKAKKIVTPPMPLRKKSGPAEPPPPAPPAHVHAAARTAEFCACGAVRTNGGDWIEGKDSAAVTLAAKAMAMSTEEERLAKAKSGGETRWKNITPKQRSQMMQKIAKRPRLKARVEDRCECGRFSRMLAEKRGHLCGKALADQLRAKEALRDR